MNEKITRQYIIDQKLLQAGWDVNDMYKLQRHPKHLFCTLFTKIQSNGTKGLYFENQIEENIELTTKIIAA